MVIEENWGIAIERVRKFLQEQTDVVSDSAFPEGECYCYKECRISLSETKARIMNRWMVSRTKVRFEGTEQDVHEIYQRFFLRFLSVGG